MYVYEKIKLDEHLPIKILDLYYESSEENVEKHWHNSIEILVPILGKVEIWDNGHMIRSQNVDVYIINSKNIHGISFVSGYEVYKGYGIQINYDYIKSIFPLIDHYEFVQPDGEVSREIVRTIYRIVDIYDNDKEYGHIAIKGLTDILMYVLLKKLLVRKKYVLQENEINNNKIVKIVNYIDQHYKENLSIQVLADHFYVSQSYLSRYFKQNFGTTIKEYIDSVRLEKAINDILHTNLSMTDIAYNNGFANPKSFNRIFKRIYKMTSHEYRKLLK